MGVLNEVATGLKDFFGEKVVSDGLRSTLWWLFRGSPLYLRLITFALVIVSLSLGAAVFLNLSDTNSILVSALVSPWENAQHAHTGIASFLLSSIVEELPDAQTANSSDAPIVTSNFMKVVASIQTQLGNWPVSTQSSKTPPTLRLQIITSPSTGNNLGSQLFLSDRSNGFLFVPGVIVTQPKLLQDKAKQSSGTDQNPDPDAAIISVTPDGEPRLFDDISMSQAVSQKVCGDLQTFNEIAQNETTMFATNALPRDIAPHFSQAYLIFQSGVARLCEANISPLWTKQREYYKDQFTASTLLEDRPYFDETLADKNVVTDLSLSPPQMLLSQAFHRTEPYIDLGGNGVVETFCRRMPINATIKQDDVSKDAVKAAKVEGTRYPYTSDAILCLDFRLRNNIENTLLMKIRRFGGYAAEFMCDPQSGCTEDIQQSSMRDVPAKYKILALLYPPLEFSKDDKERLSNKFKSLAAKNEQSQITGRISVDYVKAGSGPVMFTVPLGASRILAGKLDLSRYQELSSGWVTLFAIFAAAAFIMLFVILASYGLKVKEQERAFEAVDTVMRDVPAPYARVGADGKFLKVNDALAETLGFESAQVALPQLRDRTYEDFLADDESRDTYKEIKEERRNGAPYRSYRVSLWTGGAPGKAPKAQFEVHGWDVPTPRISGKKPGQSFGILLPAGASKVITIGGPRSA